MRTASLIAGAAAALLGVVPAASADAPKVVADIGPVHSLIARVMQGAGSPEFLLPPRVSPHGYSMRPSDAQKLADADLIVWVGPALTPWLDRAIDNLGEGAATLTLTELEGTVVHAYREGDGFAPHDHGDHGHGDHGHDEHAEDKHGHDEQGHGEEHAHADDHGDDHADDHADDHGHDKDHAHDAKHGEEHAHKDEHGHDEHGHDDHGHSHAEGESDPHVWLDPKNAALYLTAIAEALAAKDRASAALYRANAKAAKAELAALEARIAAQVEPVRSEPFIVFHDAYQYFEHRFDIEAAGALSLGNAERPGPRRLAEIREQITTDSIRCVFSEPQFDPSLAETVTEQTSARIGVIDPLGAEIEPGPGFYPALLTNIAEGLTGCLAEPS